MDIPMLFLGEQPILSLYAFGKVNGLIVESGDGLTQIVPVFNSFKIEPGVSKQNLAGQDLTNYLQKILIKEGFDLNNKNDYYLV